MQVCYGLDLQFLFRRAKIKRACGRGRTAWLNVKTLSACADLAFWLFLQIKTQASQWCTMTSTATKWVQEFPCPVVQQIKKNCTNLTTAMPPNETEGNQVLDLTGMLKQ